MSYAPLLGVLSLALFPSLCLGQYSMEPGVPYTCNNTCYNSCVMQIAEAVNGSCPPGASTQRCVCARKSWRCSKLCNCFSLPHCSAGVTLNCSLECDNVTRTVGNGYFLASCPADDTCYTNCFSQIAAQQKGLCLSTQECSCSMQAMRCTKACGCFNAPVCKAFSDLTPECTLDCDLLPSGDAPAPVSSPSPESSGTNITILIIILCVVLFLCCCAGALWAGWKYYNTGADQTDRGIGVNDFYGPDGLMKF